MSESAIFDWLCEELERHTDLIRLEARGTVRLAIRQAGLEAGRLTANQARVVVLEILPSELELRGVVTSGSLCARIASDLEAAGFDDPARGGSPEGIFARLGGDGSHED